MLTRLSFLAGGLPVQRLVPPSVYLDHWAMLDLSADADLARRFADALEQLDGTLELSWANVAEFCKVWTDEHAKNAEAVIERNIPRLFFLNPDPFVFRERDDGGPAPGDDGLLAVFAGRRPEAGHEFTARGFFAEVRGQLLETMDRMTGIVVQRVEALRTEYLADQNLAGLVDQIPNDVGSRLILKEFVAGLHGRTQAAR